MSNRWRNILLVVSLGVNLIVAGYYIYTRFIYEPKVPEHSGYHLNRDEVLRHMPNTENEIIFAGDSHIRGFEVAELFHDANMKNRGIDGDDTRGVLKRLDEMTESQPKAIFFMMGVNDLGIGRSTQDVINTYSQILEQVRNESPSTVVHVHSVFPTLSPNGYYPEINDKIVELNTGLQLLCEKHDAIWINVYDEFAKDGLLDEAYAADGIHLNGAGYLKWARIIINYIDELGLEHLINPGNIEP